MCVSCLLSVCVCVCVSGCLSEGGVHPDHVSSVFVDRRHVSIKVEGVCVFLLSIDILPAWQSSEAHLLPGPSGQCSPLAQDG